MNTDSEWPICFASMYLNLCAASGPVKNLKCNESLLPSELGFSWDIPEIHNEGVNNYQVEVKELQHSPGTKDVILVDVTNFYTNLTWAYLDQGLSKHCEVTHDFDSVLYISGGMVPYEILITAINFAGCGEQQNIYCFTQEGGNMQRIFALSLLVILLSRDIRSKVIKNK